MVLPEQNPAGEAGAFDEFSGKLGLWLKVLRVSVSLTQSQLALRAGLTQSAVSRLEQGGAGLCGPELLTLRRYLAACNYHLVITATPVSDGAKPLTLTTLQL